jgi:uncharacterized membrane protein YeiH
LQAVGVGSWSAALIGMAIVAALRFAAIRWKIRVPVFRLPGEDSGS